MILRVHNKHTNVTNKETVVASEIVLSDLKENATYE
jgi:hypothetical protein